MSRDINQIAREARELAQRVCPDSGLFLTKNGERYGGNMSCNICYCGGYTPEEIAAAEWEQEQRLESEREIEICCHGRNINCGHHWRRT